MPWGKLGKGCAALPVRRRCVKTPARSVPAPPLLLARPSAPPRPYPPQLGSREEDSAHCESFALTVFNRADRVDRAGRADKATAVTFYAASYFFEAGWFEFGCDFV